MDTEDLASDNGSDGECIKDVDKCFPGLDVGSTFTFVVETIDYMLINSPL